VIRPVRRERAATDRAFDDLVPDELRHLSELHWTPIELAIRATTLLAPRAGTRVLDVGSGIGKMCLVGALSSAATWVGVERFAPLVRASERLARALGIGSRTKFLHGDAFDLDWNGFDALYLYNPFELALFTGNESDDDYHVQVARTEERLRGLRFGTRVVTLNGFGGVMPSTLELVHQERVAGLDLVSWVHRGIAS
jgi:SAM-dependent methyltransferase